MPKYAEFYAPINDAVRLFHNQVQTNVSNEFRRQALGLQSARQSHQMMLDLENQQRQEDLMQMRKEENAAAERQRQFQKSMAIKANARADAELKMEQEKWQQEEKMNRGKMAMIEQHLTPRPVNINNWIPDNPIIKDAVFNNEETNTAIESLFGPGTELRADGSFYKNGVPMQMNDYEVGAHLPGVFGVVESLIDPIDQYRNMQSKVQGELGVINERLADIPKNAPGNKFAMQKATLEARKTALMNQLDEASPTAEDLLEEYMDRGEMIDYYARQVGSLNQNPQLLTYLGTSKANNDRIVQTLLDNLTDPKLTGGASTKPDKWSTGAQLIDRHYGKGDIIPTPENKPTAKFANQLFAKYQNDPSIRALPNRQQVAANKAIADADEAVYHYWDHILGYASQYMGLTPEELEMRDVEDFLANPPEKVKKWIKNYKKDTNGFQPDMQTLYSILEE